MQRISYLLFTALLILVLPSCKLRENRLADTDDQKIEFRIIQMNDVYEIAPIQNGKYGGMARVAHFVKTHRKEEKNTFVILSGDFLNPSLLGTIKWQGKRIQGAQMVDLMNAAGVNLVSLGNHEFDLKEEDLQARINESAFDWVSTDAFQRCGDRTYPFYRERNGKKEFFPDSYTWNIRDNDGTELSVGYFSALVPSNPVDYVFYENYTEKAKAISGELGSRCDVVLGITHLGIDEDLALTKELNNVPLLLGGHDHDNMLHEANGTRITKADANAKTVYVHYFSHDKKTGNTSIRSELVEINDAMPEDPDAASRVDNWMKIQNDNLKLVVDDPYELIYNKEEALDGLESSIRHKQTNMGNLFTAAMLWASDNKAQAAILNSGSIRIDDQISGPIVALDIFRALPFGGSIVDIEITGSLLMKVLDAGQNAKGTGAYLQYNNLTRINEGSWLIGEQSIEAAETYRVVLNDFLLTGRDIDFLTRNNPGILNLHDAPSGTLGSDIRKSIIEYFKFREF